MKMKRTVIFQRLAVVAIVGIFLLATRTNGQDQAAETDNVKVERDEENAIIRIRVPAKNGEVAWSDILRALMQTGQLNDNALKGKLPSGTLNLTNSSSRLVLLGVNTVLGPDINMRIVPAGNKNGNNDQDQSHLLVTIDRGALQDKRRDVSKRIREKLGSHDRKGRAGENYGLQLPDNWQRTDASKTLVVVVHGFNAPALRFTKLVDAFDQAGLISGIFTYPDDQPIADSALQLSAVLKEIAIKHPKRTIALVTHSMGGLVSRAVVEAPELDPGNVTKLIMVAPPSHGSLLAHLAYGLDLLDHAFPESERGEVSRFYAAVADGMNEAAVDLRPGSRFLRQLNARSRNPNIRYSIYLGTGGRFTQERLDNLRQQLKTAENHSDVVGLFTDRVDKFLADLDEVVRGKGDGVVAIKRGRLDGVEDTVVLSFTHLDALQKENQLVGHELYESVLERLQR
jgi:pimeloyl-ACP methyl ester carboxylesterase